MAVSVTLPDFREALANGGGAGARTAAELQDERLEANLNEGEDEVLGRLARDFTVPATPDEVPDLIRGIIFGIAGYAATLEFFGSRPLEQRDPVVLRYERAQALLTKVANGLVRVPGIDDQSGGSVDGSPEVYNVGPAVGLTEQAPLPPLGSPGWYGPGGAYTGGLSWG